MKTINKILILLLVMSLSSSIAQGQNKKASRDEVVVILKSGTEFSGYVKEWKVGEVITIETEAGNEYTFTGDSIDKILQMKLYEKSNNLKFGTPYNFKESGRYYSVRGSIIKGNNGDRRNEQAGLGISLLAGHRFNRFIGIGAGVGYDSYTLESGESVLPLFVEASGYTTPTHTSLSYSLAAGYGLAFTNEEYGIIDAKGGLMVHPSIGMRFGKKKLKYTLDLGYRFQKANFTFRDQWNGRSRFEQRLLYKRVTLRFGVLI